MTTDTSRPLRRRVGLGLLGVLTVLCLLWVAGYAAAGERTPAKTTVLGVEIGGLSPAAARERLESQLAGRAGAPIPVTVDGKKHAVDPAKAGLALDAQTTVARADARSWNPATIVRAFFGGGEVEPAIDVDQVALDRAVAALARKTARAPRDGRVTFAGGKAVAVAPRSGSALDREAAAEALRESYLKASRPVQLPSEDVAPDVTAAEVARAMRQFARPATSAPVTLVSAGTRVRLSTRLLGTVLRMTPDRRGHLVPVLDGAKLKQAIASRLAGLEQEPRDASIVIRDGEPVVVPAVTGRTFAAKDLAAAVKPALTKTGAARLARVKTQVSEPSFTTAEAKALGVGEKLSEFTQAFPYARYREINIGQAARYIDGTLLEPGETFSMNDTVKERTEANGYTTGTVISGGRFREELGGGVSTATTAMWTAAFYAGLERVEQRAHSFYISRYAPGLEATVAWGALDLKFRNDTPHGVLISAEADGDSITVTMYGTKRYDIDAEFGPRTNIRPADTIYDPKPGCVAQDGVDGFDITVTRVFRQGGDVVRREPMTTSYNAADQIFCSAPPG